MNKIDCKLIFSPSNLPRIEENDRGVLRRITYMKYIRTKDERIADVSLFDEYQTNNEKGESVFDGFGNDMIYFPVEDIVSMSDKIYEICDFIKVTFKDEAKDGRLKLFLLQPSTKEWVNHCREFLAKDRFYSVRLCILTDDGIIDVAEMNQKGELCLI